MSSPSLLLITGASGYVGSHVVQQALDAGYSVRATARPDKVDALKAKFAGKIDVVSVADIVTGDYTEALEGVYAIVHVAAPLPGKEGTAEMIELAVNGSLNILRQGAALRVKKAVVTSSSITVAVAESDEMRSDRVLTENDWNLSTKEEALEGNRHPIFNYGVAKTLAERAVWKFADEHPEMDITIINPPYILGPFLPGSMFAKGDTSRFSTMTLFYKNVLPTDPSSAEVFPDRQDITPLLVDVRDVARAHILALSAPSTEQVGRKRILVCGPTFTWWDAVKHLRKVRPDLRSRLPKVVEGTQILKIAKMDNRRAEAVLGLKFTDWEKTVEDSVDSILEVEKSWANAD